jgi:hypothetical protein
MICAAAVTADTLRHLLNTRKSVANRFSKIALCDGPE